MVVGGGGGLEQFSASPRPLGFGLGLKSLGLRVWSQGLTKIREIFYRRGRRVKNKKFHGFQSYV